MRKVMLLALLALSACKPGVTYQPAIKDCLDAGATVFVNADGEYRCYSWEEKQGKQNALQACWSGGGWAKEAVSGDIMCSKEPIQ